MNDVSQDAYDSVKYPWQSPVLEAFREFNAAQQLEKITIAEDAIAKRLLELNGEGDQDEDACTARRAEHSGGPEKAALAT